MTCPFCGSALPTGAITCLACNRVVVARNGVVPGTQATENLLYLDPSEPRWDLKRAGWLFGFDVPFLSDFLLDHTLLGKEMEHRVGEYWARWAQFVAGLWSEKDGMTCALRHDWDPAAGSTHVSLVCRLHVEPAERALKEDKARVLAETIRAGLGTFGLEPRRLTLPELQNWSKIARDGAIPHGFLVTQEEALTPIRQAADTPTVVVPKEFIYNERGNHRLMYEIRPWWGPGGTFLPPFSALASLKQPVTVVTILAPVTLADEIRSLLAAVARETESLAQLQGMPHQEGGVQLRAGQNKTDPQLRWAARLYAANLRRLSHPFLVSTMCFSPSTEAAQQIAFAFASAIREERASEPPTGESEAMASGAQVLGLSDQNQVAWSVAACSNLNFSWLINREIPSSVPPHADHLITLRYLADARGAAMAFRFPLCVRGGVPSIAVKQRPPDFHPGPCQYGPPRPHMIDLGAFHAGGQAYVDLRDLTKHALVVGFTGSGKTVTCLRLLHQLWCDRDPSVPFLAIESAKHEYRGLTQVVRIAAMQHKIRIYTVGNERGVPFRLNPFELLPGVRVEAHLSKLQTCFEAAIPQDIGSLSSILAEALYNSYLQCGWLLTYRYPDEGKGLSFPTMAHFVKAMEKIIDQRYVGEIQANMRGVLIGRLRPLLFGSKGRMLDVQTSCPSMDVLFREPVILELNDLNLEDKALLTLFLLMFLREYRENDKTEVPSHGLRHVTLIEEAHNVLENVGSEGSGEGAGKADTRYKAVQTICGMLAEVRALGEGLIIADQSPEKLARDAMRNTNVQLAHQIRDARDREAVGNAMVMDEEQRNFIGKEKVGQAALFYTGLEKATFIQVPKYYPDDEDLKPRQGESNDDQHKRFLAFPGYGYNARMTETEIRSHMRETDPLSLRTVPDVPFGSCGPCKIKTECVRQLVFPVSAGASLRYEFINWLLLESPKRREAEGVSFDAHWQQLGTILSQEVLSAGLPGNADTAWCLYAHLSEQVQAEFDRSYDPVQDCLGLRERELFDEIVVPAIMDSK
jgi:hypothetical protein